MAQFIILILISFFLISCQKSDITKENLKVIFHTDNLTFNSDRLTYNYRAQGNPCDMSWHVIKTKDKPDYSLTLTIKESYKCKDFESEKFKYAAILKEIFKTHDKSHLQFVRTPALQSIQPNKDWNRKLSIASSQSLHWKNWFTNNPMKSKNLKGILIDLVNEKKVDNGLKKLFQAHGIHLKLSAIDKVSSKKRGSTYYKNLPKSLVPVDRVLFDAKSYIYKIVAIK